MPEPEQTFKNHTRLLPAFHLFVLPVLLANVLYSLWHLVQTPTLGMLFGLVVAAALLTLAFLSRVQALTVQDRVIRLEMRMRLRQILPPELQGRMSELTRRQLVALRFASDQELPDLVREVLDGRLSASKEIKLRVKNWQPDWLRA
ncbi:MAG TPA: DUF6526 family protein [Vicinamibacterales bacterium]|jgi:hypothetical protein|nr:DUF6526 family protein [Vicinamibacterales bacterium]